MQAKQKYSWIYRTNFLISLQSIALGVAIAELYYFSQVIASQLNRYIIANNIYLEALIACAFASLVTIAYLIVRDFPSAFMRLAKSYRFDLIVLVALGATISAIAGGIGTEKYKEYVNYATIPQIIVLFSAPIVVALIHCLRVLIRLAQSQANLAYAKIIDSKPTENDDSDWLGMASKAHRCLRVLIRLTQSKENFTYAKFIDDKPIEEDNSDLLGMTSKAHRFAENVLNGGSKKSLAFGIDSPWGIGKSSFVNQCCSYWSKQTNSNVIVCRFEPLRYRENVNLVEKYVTELIHAIQDKVFLPEIRPFLLRYFNITKNKSTFSFLGIEIELQGASDSTEDAIQNLENILLSLNKKTE